MKRLTRSFFQRPTLQVAQDLLGKILRIGNCTGRINEVEAYIGKDDPACHAAVGKTKRNEVMWGQAGHLYVYFTYGMYHCANIVTEKDGFPAAVLIRSVEPVKGEDLMKKRRGKSMSRTPIREKNISDGPGKLCIAYEMTKQSHNGMDLCKGDGGGVYDDGFEPQSIQDSSRIGIRVGLDKKWRFFY